ncbi:D-alanyl-D-alanine carboxypeptidase family protein [Lacrimispora sp.]|uniref:D-alanyl-D-alanine carboxypeptidase family protein n=1 Tax=Lacrimispora sp. TaxID=2719234 RepID=UPI00345F6539
MRGPLKALVSFLLASQMLLMTVYANPEWPSDTGIQAEAGIVVDVDSGAVLFGQKIHTTYPPASITKVLTALVVLENSSPEEMVTFSKNAVNNVEPDSGNKLNVTEGDQLSVEDCLYSLLLNSCNQAGNALAEHVAGSMEEFVTMMNEKIEELGCQESHFDNPSGLNGDTQYVSAYDMALIAREAYSNKKLVEINSALSHTFPPMIKNPEGLTIYNEHRLVKTTDSGSEFYFPSAVAGKTGYLIKAGNTLVTYAEQDGRRLVSVILKGSPRQYFVDGKSLLQFGYDRFENIPVTGNETSYISGEDSIEINGTAYKPSDLKLEADRVITLPKGSEFSQADKTLVTDLPDQSPEGAVALIQYSYNERNVGQAYLIAESEVLPSGEESEQESSEESTGEPETNSDSEETKAARGKGFLGVIAVVGIILVLAAGGTGFLMYRKKKEAREYALRREERRRRLREEGNSADFERILRERRNTKKK